MRLKPFRLERYFAEYEFAAPYLLCCSDCEILSVGVLLKLEQNAQEELFSLGLGYTESLGSPELRTEIASLYQKISSGQILVHAGAEEAIFNFMNVVLEAADHIVVHAPYYQSLGEVARSICADITEWRGNPERAWDLDLQFLEDNLTDRTVLLLPGTVYGDGYDCFRIGFGRRNVATGVQKLEQFLADSSRRS